MSAILHRFVVPFAAVLVTPLAAILIASLTAILISQLAHFLLTQLDPVFHAPVMVASDTSFAPLVLTALLLLLLHPHQAPIRPLSSHRMYPRVPTHLRGKAATRNRRQAVLSLNRCFIRYQPFGRLVSVVGQGVSFAVGRVRGGLGPCSPGARPPRRVAGGHPRRVAEQSSGAVDTGWTGVVGGCTGVRALGADDRASTNHLGVTTQQAYKGGGEEVGRLGRGTR